MRIFHENLYFATMVAEGLGKLIAYRSNRGKFNIGDSVFDLLCISAAETSYLLKELFSGGEVPIIITAGDRAVIVDRHLLYSVGVCCFVVPDFPADIVCSMLSGEEFGACLMSPLATELAINASACGDELFAQAYISLSGYKNGLSVFSDRAETRNCLDVARRICEEMGCSLVQTNGASFSDFELPEGVIYSNSLYSLSVLTAAFVSKIISDERSVCIDLTSGGHVSISVDCNGLPNDIRGVLDYLCAVARDKDAQISFDTSDSGLTLNVCPFYVDVGLMGVKNPQELRRD